MGTQDDFTEILKVFRVEARELLQGIGEAMLTQEKAANETERQNALKTAFRLAHNLKGAAGTLGLEPLANLVHALEDVLGAIRERQLVPTPEVIDEILSNSDVIEQASQKAEIGGTTLNDEEAQALKRLQDLLPGASSAPAAAVAHKAAAPSAQSEAAAGSASSQTDDYVRVSNQKLDTLLAQMEELLEMKIRMEETHRHIKNTMATMEAESSTNLDQVLKPMRGLALGMEQDIQYLSKLLRQIQDELLELRMVAIGSLFPMLRRAVRDVCRKRDLEVDLTLEGGDYELDRRIVTEMKSPLLHLLRNSVGHGIESASDRQSAGKPAAGQVSMRVTHQGNRIALTISDDGRGINFDKVRDRARELGWITDSDQSSQTELTRMLFQSGMTTAVQADSISGRGVGLNAVKKVVETLGGSLDVESTPKLGSRFRLLLPLTLAMDKGLFITTREQNFVIPKTAVQRVVSFRSEDVSVTDDVANLWFEEESVPLARLEPSLHLTRFSMDESKQNNLAVILSSAESRAAIVVDEIQEEADIVVRDLGSFVRKLEGVSGLTVSASGDMFFVLDPSDLVRWAIRPLGRGRSKSDPAGTATADHAEKLILVVDDSVTSRMLNLRLLLDVGFQVETANDGRQALETMDGRQFDLVLADVQMPYVDGYELTRRIKAHPKLSQTPVILLTSRDRPEDREKGIDAGADAYLLKKELSQAELVATIEQLI